MTDTPNPFATHGIEHLSPSSLNLYIEAPGIWAVQYLGKQRGGGGPKMWRGSAVEKGYIAYLRSFDLASALTVAHYAYDQEVQAANGQGPAAEDAARLIQPMLEECLEWSPPSMLNAAQIEIEHWFDGIPIKIKGFVDLCFDNIDIDLKTTTACPSKPRWHDVRQVSLYRAARKRPGGLLYVTDKKHAYFPVTDEMMEKGLREFEEAAHKVMKLLGAFSTAEEIMAVLPIDWDHYRAPKLPTRAAASASDFVAA